MDKVLMILEDMDRKPAWLCRQAGLSHTLFTLMKNGERTITKQTKNKIAQVLKIRKELLFT
tara:strand:- start:12734 stop:12916 length:183 start_codon:yes stop_codon:yes gene_type:complete